jgi:multidrug efflux system membrane fusion protein
MNKPLYKKTKFWVLLFLILGLVFRFTFPEVTEKEIEKKEEVKLTHVRTQIFKSENFNNTLKVFGNAIPFQHSTLISKYSGDIVEIYKKQGDLVKKGEPILKIEDNGLVERLRTSELDLEKATLEFNSAVKLQTTNLISELQFMQVKTDLERAKSEYEISKSNFEYSTIKANFTGFIENFDFEIGEYVFKEQEVGTLSDLSKIKVYINIPENYINFVKKNTPAIIKFPNQDVEAYINYIAKVGDTATHTFKTEIISKSNTENLFSGLTTPVYISLGYVQAYQISPSYINNDAEGNLFIKTVKNDKVKNHKIKILNHSDNGFWISGKDKQLPDEINLITIGHLLVNEGVKVKHTLAKQKD